jgi:hypothetical protein
VIVHGPAGLNFVPAAFAALTSTIVAVSGCCEAYIESAAQARIKYEDALNRQKALESRIAALEADIKSRENQVAELQGTQKLRRERLIAVHKVELGAFTRGRNFDDKPGDDGFKVYLNLVDAEGDRVKQAGWVRVEAFDLDAGGKRLGLWDFDLDQSSKSWFSSLGNYGYVFECRWQGGAPARSPVTVRVRFTDLFSGRTFEVQSAVEFEFAPATIQPAK